MLKTIETKKIRVTLGQALVEGQKGSKPSSE